MVYNIYCIIFICSYLIASNLCIDLFNSDPPENTSPKVFSDNTEAVSPNESNSNIPVAFGGFSAGIIIGIIICIAVITIIR